MNNDRIFIAAYGIGGCWSGYTHAKYVSASNEMEAEDAAYDLAFDEFSDHLKRGISYGAFIKDDDDPTCGGRLKQSARDMLQYD